jgi:sugar/nucleoside kinase (ribokinase family)
MTRIIGLGDLVADLYYKNGKLIGIDGGKTTSNIIANLSYLGFRTSMFGVCGNDIYGRIALNSLIRLGVDVTTVIIKDIDTKKFHNLTDNGKSTARCPYCNIKPTYKNSKIDVSYVKKNIDKEDILVIDNISKTNEKEITSLSKTNSIVIDMGYYNSLENSSNNEIEKLLSNKFTIINMNNRVERYLIKRLNINSMELYKLLKVKMLIITRGKKGADFLYNNKLISKKLKSVGTEVDVSGAGDAFFAIILSEYIKNNFNIDDDMINYSFNKATEITKKVVSSIGARSHISTLYKTEKVENICSCKKLDICYNEFSR